MVPLWGRFMTPIYGMHKGRYKSSCIHIEKAMLKCKVVIVHCIIGHFIIVHCIIGHCLIRPFYVRALTCLGH